MFAAVASHHSKPLNKKPSKKIFGKMLTLVVSVNLLSFAFSAPLLPEHVCEDYF